MLNIVCKLFMIFKYLVFCINSFLKYYLLTTVLSEYIANSMALVWLL